MIVILAFLITSDTLDHAIQALFANSGLPLPSVPVLLIIE